MRQRTTTLNPDPQLQAYVIGLAIGDGNLSKPNGRAVRLRITCGTKYPLLVRRISAALTELLPDNRVNVVRGNGNFVNVSVYSNHLESLLGWRALAGSKHVQRVCVPDWIVNDPALSIHCLRGLVETDGSIYLDAGYLRVIFSTVIPCLAEQVHRMMQQLGFEPRSYCVPTGSTRKMRHPKYQVRLARDAQGFLDLVRPMKS